MGFNDKEKIWCEAQRVTSTEQIYFTKNKWKRDFPNNFEMREGVERKRVVVIVYVNQSSL